MQKARGHRAEHGSRSLQASGFRFCFTPLTEVLFTFPSRYWFTIGLSGVFSLGGWYRRFQTGFPWSRPTQDTAMYEFVFEYSAFTFYGPTFQKVLLTNSSQCCRPTTPGTP